jgi:indolepyruvate ferredoxin oxidoreductase beta subunit
MASLAIGRGFFTVDAFRHGIERMEPANYLRSPYFERWLAAIERGAAERWDLGHEIALCGRLVKGYGSTNERGKENLLHIIDHLAAGGPADAAARAEAIRGARIAALADEAGTALDQALARHGAPPRPVKAVPIRFIRKPHAQAAAGDD